MSDLCRWMIDTRDLPNEWKEFVGFDALAKSILLTSFAQRSKQPLLIVFSEKAEARAVVDNLHFLLGPSRKEKIHYIAPAEFDFHRSVFPDFESLADRNVALFRAMNDANERIFITTAAAMVQKLMPPEVFLEGTQIITAEQELDRDQFVYHLVEAGYQKQPVAYDPGTFSVRGEVVDVFSPVYEKPIRILMFGDLVEEIRYFDPNTQRSLELLPKMFCVPLGQTLVPNKESFSEVAAAVKERLDHQGIPKRDRDALLEELRSAALTGQASFLFPLLCKEAVPLLDYFNEQTQVFWDGSEKLLDTIGDREIPALIKNHALFEKEPLPIAEFKDLFLNKEEFGSLLNKTQHFFFEAFSRSDSPKQVDLKTEPISLAKERGSKAPSEEVLSRFAKRFRDWMDLGNSVHVVCHTRTHAERVKLLFEPYRLDSVIHSDAEIPFQHLFHAESSKLHLWQGHITQSGNFPELRLIVLSEEELFGHKKRAPKASAWSNKTDSAKVLSSFRELRVNDFVVHKQHGIGKYLGLKSMQFQGVQGDYFLIEYRDGDKLYVPVYRMNVIQKYVGGEAANPVVDKLGGERWTKAKRKAERAVAEMAEEFLKIHAKRKLVPAHAFEPPDRNYHEFEMRFPFDETPDQLRAIEEVMRDLSQSHPMDRLVVGDVGYGKTEVAMRAAFRAVIGNKQVAVLVPTTVLAFQHFENFKQRFSETAVRIEMVSRLRSAKENRLTMEKVKEGQIDIVIGTHRLLSQDVGFKDLGLIVVDEEHRFGVIHKERLKKLCESVHVLSMTATPIPRTLNMSMAGIRDISLITTPPPDRLAIRTFVCRRTEEVIEEAIQNELTRGGQVFFVHNRIESIFKIKEALLERLPKLKVEVVHGQMDANTLEKKMLAFYHDEFDVLLTTAIIESGIDIPKVNTILIDKAHHLGLAQIYQLRGRVGRSDKRAYCYLLAPPENQMTDDAKQRLKVIQRHTDLGSGFNIASHDLEIRGAGDLLGKSQSGHFNAIGVDLYFELLEESIRYLRGEKKKEEIEPEINLKIPAFFPADYLPDVSERVVLYRRLSGVDDEESISNIEEEIRDRFGPLPEEVVNLLGLMKIKLYLKKMYVTHMNCGPKRSSLQFSKNAPVAPEKIVKLIQKEPKHYSLTPDHKFVFQAENSGWEVLFKEIKLLAPRLGFQVG